ncbi:type II toxin-antitoxin system VapC family toxin [Mariniluteicoccus flavus]
MIIDTSAAVAMLRDEPESADFLAAIESSPVVRMSAASVLELAIVTTSSGPALVDDFLHAMGVRVVAVDAEHLRWARHAHHHFGRGSGSPARLNFGDCLAYAAARATEEPLLYKGNDFIHTDVRRAL